MKVFFIIIFSYIALTWCIGIHTLIHMRRPKPDNIVYHSEFLTMLGLALGFIILAIGFVITLFDHDAAASALPVFCVISAVCSILIVIQRTFKITYYDDYFEYRNIFGITRRYSYGDITGYRKTHSDDLVIYVKGGKVLIDMMSVGQHKFLSFAKKEYRKIHIGQSLPTLKPKFDLFNGNVTNLSGAFLVISIMLVACIAFVVMSIVFPIQERNRTIDDLSFKEVTFTRYDFVDDDLYFYGNNKEHPYNICYYENALSDSERNALISTCNTGERLTVGYFYDSDDEQYNVWSIEGESGRLFLSFDVVKECCVQSMSDARTLLLSFALLGFAFVALFIYVGRHPEKFPKKFVWAFFPKGQIKIPE